MRMGLRAKLTGTGMHVPDRVVTNFDLAKLMDTSDEWIRQRSGISERHHIREGEQPADLAYQAADDGGVLVGDGVADRVGDVHGAGSGFDHRL